MKTSSAKAKGRRGAQEVRDLLLDWCVDLQFDDIQVTSGSVTGEDIKLSPRARHVYDYAIEVKNTEAINVWKAYAQAEAHASKKEQGCTPILFFRRNRSELMVCLKAEHFMRLTR